MVPWILILFLPGPLTILLGSDSKSPHQGGCLSCHAGIMPFTDGEMMAKIRERGEKVGDPEGCVICHGGTPSAAVKQEAHRDSPPALRAYAGPQRFYPNPGNLMVAAYTCGQCHAGYPQRLSKSVLGTETGEIHGNLCMAALDKRATVGIPETKHFAKRTMVDEDGLVPGMGSFQYKDFMASLTHNPELFAGVVHSLPILDNGPIPESAGPQCRHCHEERPAGKALEDEHGSGCSACHVPYRRGGVYLGNDMTIDKSQPGKLLIHRLQGTGSTPVTLPGQDGQSGVKNETYNGILLDNCFTCHHDVRKEHLNPIGSVMTHYGTFHDDGTGGALLCQDCHTTIEMHGDGNIPLTSHAQMEVKCEDCHGTVEQAPWELPFGYGGKPGNRLPGKPRGLANQPLEVKGARYDAKEGYLLTSRGNPFGNVVKDGNRVLLHSASGQSFTVPVLKFIDKNKTWKSSFSRQAMFEVKEHREKMACLSCHGDRVQSCYGCHVESRTQPGKHQ